MTFAIESIGQWIRMEHYRLHCVEEWPDSSHKDATLISIRSALQRLETASTAAVEPAQCMVCASRKTKWVVLQMPSRSTGSPAITRLTA
jgi:hypothetical protein